MIYGSLVLDQTQLPLDSQHVYNLTDLQLDPSKALSPGDSSLGWQQSLELRDALVDEAQPI